MQPRDTTESANEDRQGYSPAFFPEKRQTGFLGRCLWKWDARTGERLSSIRYAVSLAGRALCSHLLRGSLIREILRECCSLPRRIGTIYATKLYRRGVHFGSLRCQQYQRSNAMTLACMRDTQRISESRPWATSLDLALFVDGWQQGAEWGLSQSDKLESGSEPPYPASSANLSDAERKQDF